MGHQDSLECTKLDHAGRGRGQPLGDLASYCSSLNVLPLQINVPLWVMQSSVVICHTKGYVLIYLTGCWREKLELNNITFNTPSPVWFGNILCWQWSVFDDAIQCLIETEARSPLPICSSHSSSNREPRLGEHNVDANYWLNSKKKIRCN